MQEDWACAGLYRAGRPDGAAGDAEAAEADEAEKRRRKQQAESDADIM